jgi:predicted DCC family thiol-disulfide oxidoreductase YuxK
VHLLFYDGVCGLCDRVVQFVLRHDRERVFQFAALQTATAERALQPYGRDPRVLDSVYVVADAGSDRARLIERGRAILFLMRHAGGVWRVLAALGSLLPTRVIDFLYRRVAGNRYRIFGKLESCRVPSPDERSRFLEG